MTEEEIMSFMPRYVAMKRIMRNDKNRNVPNRSGLEKFTESESVMYERVDLQGRTKELEQEYRDAQMAASHEKKKKYNISTAERNLWDRRWKGEFNDCFPVFKALLSDIRLEEQRWADQRESKRRGK